MRHFPLNEPALRASMLVECVPADKALTFIKVLFEMQDKWAFSSDFLASLKTIANVGGVTPEDFDACMARKDVEDAIVNTRKEASEKFGVESTPTFFVGDQKVVAPTLNEFSKLIDPLLEPAK